MTKNTESWVLWASFFTTISLVLHLMSHALELF